MSANVALRNLSAESEWATKNINVEIENCCQMIPVKGLICSGWSSTSQKRWDNDKKKWLAVCADVINWLSVVFRPFSKNFSWIVHFYFSYLDNTHRGTLVILKAHETPCVFLPRKTRFWLCEKYFSQFFATTESTLYKLYCFSRPNDSSVPRSTGSRLERTSANRCWAHCSRSQQSIHPF